MFKLTYALFYLATALQASLPTKAETAVAVAQPYIASQCPSTLGWGVIRILSGDSRAGQYVAAATTPGGIVSTTDALGDAMRVSLSTETNPGPIRILNPATDGYGFLGLTTNEVKAAFGPKSTDWTGMTYITDPNARPIESLYRNSTTVSKGLWYIGIKGELEFNWDNTDGSVYKMTQSVQMNPKRLYQTSNLDAYINHWFPNNSSGHAEVSLVYEPLGL
ncbi:hypothetical protein AURDEDRAFT_167257 [Auricularia subglabra TFB-10046 SS5]|nr:hypothetical protein AURDEDRAFT_167257 [Auricularia subglabra TFB-10046 SS5]